AIGRIDFGMMGVVATSARRWSDPGGTYRAPGAEIRMAPLIATYPSASTVTVRVVLIDREELEHRVAVGLGHKVIDGSVLVGAEVWPGGRGNGDVALEYRSGLGGRDPAGGTVTPAPPSGQAHSSGRPGVVNPRHRSVGRDQPALPLVLDHGR